jgi:aspartate/methionine/tyrosine aminotransferase
VDINLTESGIHPFTLKEFLFREEIDKLLALRLGYGQTNGAPELREIISRIYPGSSSENIIVTNGTAEANFLTVWSMLEPGDEIFFMLPNYKQMDAVARSLGVTVKPFFLQECDDRWISDLEQLKKSVTPETKMIAVCHPNNPTGAVLSEEEIDEIIKIAGEVNAWVFSDEVYRGAELDGLESPTFWGRYEKVLVNGGLSKAYGLPGLRLGWLTGPEKMIDLVWSYRDYTTISSNLISQFLATLALQPERRKKILQRTRKILNENLAIIEEWVKSHNTLFQFIPPVAGGILFLKYYIDIDSRELMNHLRESQSVFLMDGESFGMGNYLRIGFGGRKDELEEGLQRFDSFLKANKWI